MLKSMVTSYLSPLYWIIRFMGKDLKERSDLDDDLFRMTIVPTPGSNAKTQAKLGKTIFCKIAGYDFDDFHETLQGYWETVAEGMKGNYMLINPSAEYISDHFSIEVTEEQREDILDALSGKSLFVVVTDELERIREMAESDAKRHMMTRTYDKYREQALSDAEEELNEAAGWD